MEKQLSDPYSLLMGVFTCPQEQQREEAIGVECGQYQEAEDEPLSSSTKSSPGMWGSQPSLSNFLDDLRTSQKAIIYASSPTIFFPSHFFNSTCFSHLCLQRLIISVLYSVTATQILSRDLNTDSENKHPPPPGAGKGWGPRSWAGGW